MAVDELRHIIAEAEELFEHPDDWDQIEAATKKGQLIFGFYAGWVRADGKVATVSKDRGKGGSPLCRCPLATIWGAKYARQMTDDSWPKDDAAVYQYNETADVFMHQFDYICESRFERRYGHRPNKRNDGNKLRGIACEVAVQLVERLKERANVQG